MRADGESAAGIRHVVTTIAVIGAFHAVPPADELRAALPDDRIVAITAGDEFGPAVEAEVLLGSPNPERIRAFIASAPKLRWIHTFSAGVDRLLLPEIIERDGLTLTNNTGAYDVPIAEHVMAMLFAAAKGLPEHVTRQARHEWGRDVVRTELRDTTLVIVGLGSIGGELARLAAGIGMRVIGVRRDTSRSVPGVGRVVAAADLETVAREADYVVVTAALTPETKGLVSAEVLAALKPTAWVVNIARGPIVDEGALIAALRDRRIGGAALDVFDTEPLPADSPLWDLPNVILTPHVSGNSPRVRQRSLAFVVENVRRFKAGEPLLNVVDKKAGY